MSQLRRVGLLLDDSLDRPDGVQQYVLTLGNWLSQQGFEVHYLVGQTNRTDIANVHSLSRNWRARFNQNRLSVPRGAKPKEVRRLLDELNLDVLHVQLPCHPLFGGRVVNLLHANVAAVGTFHILPSGVLSAMGTKALGLAQRKTIRRFDRLLAVSEPARDFAKKSYEAAIDAVVPNMVDTTIFKSTAPKPAVGKKIVFLGRLVERKGCLYLLKAVKELVGNPAYGAVPAFSVEIGGGGPLEPKLKDYVLHQGLQDRVHFHGFIEPSAKAQFLAQASVAVFPATGGESFGIVLLEAMAAGAGVVLGGNNPGYTSVLGASQQTVFDPRNAAGLAATLAELLQDPLQAETLHDEQQKLVQKFDVSVVGPQIVNNYQQAIAKRWPAADNKQ